MIRRLPHLLLVAIICGIFVVALQLTPNASDIGTHQQLGLPPCPLYALTDIPCPACGLTTSITHVAHGHLRASLAAHPFGPAIALLFVVMACMSAYGLVRPFRWTDVLMHRWVYRGMLIGIAIYIVAWMLRVFGSFD
jgi:hypothetical protein